MIPFPDIDPVILDLWGPIKIRWYGVMYLLALFIIMLLGKWRINNAQGKFFIKTTELSDIAFWGFLGAVIGGRIGYVFFYNFSFFLKNPLWLFDTLSGGMSFHGGLLGVLIAIFILCRKRKIHFFDLMDFIAPLVCIGLGLGRIGNFIGSELYGRITDVPWAMVFPTGGDFPRHPSQLYQAFLEGILLFSIMWFFTSRYKPRMSVSGLFLFLYGSFRFFVEFFREPDSHLGFVWLDKFSMGQLLSMPMILLGAIMFFLAYKTPIIAGWQKNKGKKH